MKFGDRVRLRREELGMMQQDLASRLGITPSAVANYEKNLSFPREEIFLRMFDSLQTDPNSLLRDSFRGGREVLTAVERQLLKRFRALAPGGREAVRELADSLYNWQEEMEADSPACHTTKPE